VEPGDAPVVPAGRAKLAATLFNGPFSPPSIAAIGFGEGGALLAVAGGDGYVYVVDVATRSVIGTLHDTQIRGETPSLVAFSPDGRLLAAEFTNDGDTEVWSVASGESVGWLPGTEIDSDVQVGFSPDSRRLVFAQLGDPGLRIFDVYPSK
jgi:WD40 repeat protein